jgi:hypothetical protein
MTKTQGLKLGTRALLLLITLISFAAFAYAHDPQYDEQNHTYRSGYMAGFEHGNKDQQERTNFDFRHDRTYRTPSRDEYNRDSRQDLNFRLGYVEGYADGYFRQSPMIDFQQQQQHRSGGLYKHNYQGDGFPDQDVVTVFTGKGYQGYSRDFGIGQYPSLEGRLDDDIQSVRLNGSIRVVLFEDDKFRGKRIVLDRDNWDLGDFRKKTGSMIIERVRYGQFR